MENLQLNSKKRHKAYYDMVNGASKELDITTSALADILKIHKQRIYEWKSNNSIPFNDPTKQAEIQLNTFITLYNQLSSFYLSIGDAVQWLKEPNQAFGGKSPIQYMANEPYGLKEVVDYLRHRMNP